MKLPFFKTILAVSAMMFVWNCTSEVNSITNQMEAFSEEAKALQTENGILYITEDNLVKNENGDVVGVYNEDGTITSENGDVLYENVNKEELEGTTLEYEVPVSSASNENNQQNQGENNENSTNSQENTQNTQNSSNSNGGENQNVESSANDQPVSSAQQSINCDGKCYDTPSGTCVEYYQNLKGANDEQYAYNNSCVLQCYYDPTQKACGNLGITNPTPASSSAQQQTQSSSSKANSSNSQVNSSSSVTYSGSASLPKAISGGASGSGYATRYWDSCKPHCAWSGKGGPIARSCQTNGTSTAGVDEVSVCDGGNAGTCFDQTPQIVNDTIAYAFAATPGGGNDCGKCYMLTFKGTGASATNTPTDSHHQKIKGKHLIVMSNNIGYDVANNQFDLMIPGGGPGAFNGCSRMGISCAGSQYGGFLTTCNYDKDCLIKMCNSEYANNSSLKNGCLFLANWMDAANNPEVDYIQVECPAALSAKY